MVGSWSEEVGQEGVTGARVGLEEDGGIVDTRVGLENGITAAIYRDKNASICYQTFALDNKK